MKKLYIVVEGTKYKLEAISAPCGYEEARQTMLEAFSKVFLASRHADWAKISSMEEYRETFFGFTANSAWAIQDEVTNWQLIEIQLTKEQKDQIYFAVKKEADYDWAADQFKIHTQYEEFECDAAWHADFVSTYGFMPEEAMDPESEHFLLDELLDIFSERQSCYCSENETWYHVVQDVLTSKKLPEKVPVDMILTRGGKRLVVDDYIFENNGEGGFVHICPACRKKFVDIFPEADNGTPPPDQVCHALGCENEAEFTFDFCSDEVSFIPTPAERNSRVAQKRSGNHKQQENEPASEEA